MTMRKLYTLLLLSIISLSINATTYTINISGFTYSPATLTVNIGDVVTISANPNHPLLEVDQATWTANGTSTLSTGFGKQTTNYTYTVTSTNSMYYVCEFHAGMGMKGKIDVSIATKLNENSSASNKLSIFPNPVRDNFTIKYNAVKIGKMNAKLFSITGQEVANLLQDKVIELGDVVFKLSLAELLLPKGLYLLEINADDKKSIHKIIVD